MEETITGTVSGADFNRAILAIEKSAAKDDSRPVLAGICMEIGARIDLVAADGFRLSHAYLACKWSNDFHPNAVKVIFAHDPLVAFARKVRTAPTVTIESTGGTWIFRNDKTREAAIIPTIDGTYPDWKAIANDVVGEEPESIATFNARYLCDAAASAPSTAMLTILRKSGGGVNAPGVMYIRDLDRSDIAQHIIMPMIADSL